ncbi:MAG: DUF29 domain-containing protein [Microcystaceae cyanobacterium]
MTIQTHLTTLYESNYLNLLEETIQQLKLRQLNKLDYEHLIEELEALVSSEKRRVVNLLEQIIRHLLMYQYWSVEHDYNANHLPAEIISFRNQINKHLTTNLRNYLQDNLEDTYQDAKDYVKAKTNLSNLPLKCPYTLFELLDKSFLPLPN